MSRGIASVVGAQPTFTGRVNNLLERIECRPASTHVEIEAFMRLRYEAYLKEGAVLKNEGGKLEDRFDLMSNVWNFGFY